MTASEKVLFDIEKMRGVRGVVVFRPNGDVLATKGSKIDSLPVVASFLMTSAGQIAGEVGAERLKNICFSTGQGDNIMIVRFSSVCLGIRVDSEQRGEQVMDRVLKILRSRLKMN